MSETDPNPLGLPTRPAGVSESEVAPERRELGLDPPAPTAVSPPATSKSPTTRVKVVYRDADDLPKEVRAWHAVRREVGWVYDPSEKVAIDPIVQEIILADMGREWRQLFARYKDVPEFIDLVQSTLAALGA